jgi:hypothetical protein
MKKFWLAALLALVTFGFGYAVPLTPPVEPPVTDDPSVGGGPLPPVYGTSANVAIGGTLTEVFSLKVPDTYKNDIKNGSTAETWNIGDVVVNSNVKNWSISLESAHSGNLVLPGDLVVQPEYIPYTVTLGSLASNVSLSTKWTSGMLGRTAKTGNVYALSIMFGPSNDFYQAGTYSDTITVTITHG